MKIILASASPRRAELLRSAGIPFDTLVTEADESRLAGESAGEMVRRLAEAKARAAVRALSVQAAIASAYLPIVVIGADTVVELGDYSLGKPGSPAAAHEMLQLLSGKTHSVLTGLALIRVPDGAARFAMETTAVHFAQLSAGEIERYVATGEPLDKAGAYAVQGIAGRFIDRIEGSYSNVVGLPVSRVYRLLRELGWQSSVSQES